MSTVNLEVGKSYKSTSGDIFDVTEHTPGHRFGANFTAVSRTEGIGYGFSDDGRYDPFETHPRNLIEEVSDG
jgi:hypothetical protein